MNYYLDNRYLDKFWNVIESSKFIYLDDELINWICDDENRKIDFISAIKQKCVINTEYQIINDSISIKIESLKFACRYMETPQSNTIRHIIAEIEQIHIFYIKYIAAFNHEINQRKLIKNIYINKCMLLSNSKLYLITTTAKAKENIFKFGSTNNEKSRKATYNTGNLKVEQFFYVAMYNCYDAISLERRISKLLINFKIPNESEIYQLHFLALDKIIKAVCNTDNDSVAIINNFLNNDYDTYLKLKPIKFEKNAQNIINI
jgi:hypothetical protein